jgi:hypothetical protein
MVSKTSMLPLVRAFDLKGVDAGLREKPQLVKHRDEHGRNWLHVCCATSLDGRDAKSSIRTADVLLAHGIDRIGRGPSAIRSGPPVTLNAPSWLDRLT